LIDPITNTTVGAGMIIDEASESDINDRFNSESDRLNDHVERREFHWERGLVSEESRETRNGHKGKTVILTGVRGIGKREIASKLEKRLFELNLQTYYLGVSNIIGGLDSDVEKSFVNRDEHIRRLGELARIITDAGLIFISTFDGADELDLSVLRTLNTPKELFVVHIGDDSKKFDVNLSLGSNVKADDAVARIVEALTAESVIVDYQI